MDDECVTFHVMTLTGKIITIKAPPIIFVKDIKSILLARGCAPPPDEQRLIYAGKELTDEATLEESVGIMLHKEPRLHLVLRMRGMISTWTTSSPSSDADLGNMFLLDPEGRPPPPLDFFDKKYISMPDTEYSYKLHEEHRLLSPLQRRRCMEFLDLIWADMTRQQRIIYDLKVKFESIDVLHEILSFKSPEDEEHNPEAVHHLLALHPKPRSDYEATLLSPILVMRLTRGPVPGCIKFHTDNNAEHVSRMRQTAQLSLNDDSEYIGGRLCFITQSGVSLLRRPAGSLTIHSALVLHGVTRLIEGSRYGLFVLDKCAELGDNQVVHVGRAYARRLLNIPNNTPTCSICLSKDAIFACIPCGHLCLCGDDCREPFQSGQIKTCPVCRTSFRRLQKIYY